MRTQLFNAVRSSWSHETIVHMLLTIISYNVDVAEDKLLGPRPRPRLEPRGQGQGLRLHGDGQGHSYCPRGSSRILEANVCTRGLHNWTFSIRFNGKPSSSALRRQLVIKKNSRLTRRITLSN